MHFDQEITSDLHETSINSYFLSLIVTESVSDLFLPVLSVKGDLCMDTYCAFQEQNVNRYFFPQKDHAFSFLSFSYRLFDGYFGAVIPAL